MKIGRVIIKSFRSISSVDFETSGGKLALVGGNESGKSNVLLAIQKFLNKQKLDLEDRNQPALLNTTITVYFRDFTEGETANLCKLLKIESISELAIHRDGESYTVVSPSIPEAKSIIDQPSSKPSVNENTDDTSKDPATEDVDRAQQISTNDPDSEDTEDGQSNIEESLNPEQITQEILNLLPKAIPIKTIEGLIKGKNIPLDELYPIEGEEVKKGSLNNNQLNTIRNFLALGGITEEDIKEEDTAKRYRIINRKAAEIASKLSQAWKQERIEIRMTVDSLNLVIIFKDHGSVPEGEEGLDSMNWIWTYPEDRSDGFRWFVTFYSSYLYAQLQTDTAIFLIDEAGGALNKRAQKDLLTEFDKLTSGNNQIMYATHSKFMVSWDFRNDVYAVVKKRGSGTEVSAKWWSKYSQDQLPPPLDELDLTWSGDLLASENLILEGFVDVEVLRHLKTVFQDNGIPEEPFLQFKLIPGMGVFDSMIELGEACNFHKKKSLLLFDSDSDGISGRDQARGKNINEENLDTLCGSPTPKVFTIEDLLPRRLYFQYLNQVGKEIFGDKWSEIIMVQGVDSLGLIEAIKQRLTGSNGFTQKEASEFLRDRKYHIAMFVLKNLTLNDFSESQQTSIKNLYKNLREKLEKI